jgi:hypothetical protein
LVKSDAEKVQFNIKARIGRMMNVGVKKMGARNFYLKCLLDAANATHGGDKRELVLVRARIFKKHGAAWRELDDDNKRMYTIAAESATDERREDGRLEIDHVRHRLELQTTRSLEDIETRNPYTFEACRFTDDAKQRLRLSFNSIDNTRTKVESLRDEAKEAPQLPDAEDRFNLVSIKLDEKENNGHAAWMDTVCRHRDHFRQCGFIITLPGGVVQYSLFGFALQNPLVLGLIPMRLRAHTAADEDWDVDRQCMEAAWKWDLTASPKQASTSDKENK